MGYNGSAILAMAGKDCVAIACDRRYGVQVCMQAFPVIFGHSMFVNYTGANNGNRPEQSLQDAW